MSAPIISRDLHDRILAFLEAIDRYEANILADGECQATSDYEAAKEAIADQLLRDLSLPTQPAGDALEEFRDARRRYIPPALRFRVLERDRFACVKCAAISNLSMDHVIPFSRGGLTTFENLQTLCRSCNSSKRDRA